MDLKEALAAEEVTHARLEAGREAARNRDVEPPKPFDVGPYGLVVNGKPTFQEWYDFGLNLREIKTAIQWAVGDWINYGEEHYPDRYAQAEDETKYAYGTLRNYASIAARVDCHTRVTGLSWSHHAAVAALPQEQQTEVLAMAKTERLSRDDIKPIVQEKLGKPPAPKVERATFEAEYTFEYGIKLSKSVDAERFLKAIKHKDATITVTVTYPAVESEVK